MWVPPSPQAEGPGDFSQLVCKVGAGPARGPPGEPPPSSPVSSPLFPQEQRCSGSDPSCGSRSPRGCSRPSRASQDGVRRGQEVALAQRDELVSAGLSLLEHRLRVIPLRLRGRPLLLLAPQAAGAGRAGERRAGAGQVGIRRGSGSAPPAIPRDRWQQPALCVVT